MFGVVPKSLWQRTNPADDNNMCDWTMRLLLIEDGDRLILFDTGIGDKQSEKFFSHYYLSDHNSLEPNNILHYLIQYSDECYFDFFVARIDTFV